MKININSAAAALDGCEYRKEGNPDLFASMKEAGLVAVFGASDDLIEFRGAIDDEAGHGYAYFSEEGLLETDCEDERCPYFEKLLAGAPHIESIFDPDNTNTSWIYKTDIPHAGFNVLEDGFSYCHGIVFDLSNIGSAADLKHPYAQNANLTKWGAHTLGMDEWTAFETYEAAAAHSFEINSAMQSRDKHNDILCFNYPAPWPWDAENHALDLAKTKAEGM